MQRQQTGGRLKAAMFMLIAVVIAALIAFIVWRMLQAADTQLKIAQKGPKKVEVVVAATDLYMGIPITLDDLKTTEVLPNTFPEALVFANVSDLVGRTPRERILAEEIIREERLADPSAGTGLNAIITPGMRAMTIEADAESSLGGFLQPGNYVDVIVTIRPDDKSVAGKWVTETILQSVRVLAVSDTTKASTGEEKKSRSQQQRSGRRRIPVTLELRLEDAEKLALASSRGDLHVVLRSDIDIILQETTGPINTAALLGVDATEAEAVVAETRARTGRAVRTKPEQTTPDTTIRAEVIQGSDLEEVRFDQNSGEKVSPEKSNRRGGR